MSKESETRIIVNYNTLGESSEPILVIKPGESEEWCSEVHIQGSSTIRYDKNIVYTTTNAPVSVTRETKKSKVRTRYDILCGCRTYRHEYRGNRLYFE